MPTEMARYWRHAAVPGVDLLRARYITHRYARHAHETYTVGVIESGVEEFDYGGQLLRAGPVGQLTQPASGATHNRPMSVVNERAPWVPRHCVPGE